VVGSVRTAFRIAFETIERAYERDAHQTDLRIVEH
jgi:hypothetical protein